MIGRVVSNRDLSTLRQHKPHASYGLCLQEEEEVQNWKDQTGELRLEEWFPAEISPLRDSIILMFPMGYALKKQQKCLIGKTNKGNHDWKVVSNRDLSTLRQHKPHVAYGLCFQVKRRSAKLERPIRGIVLGKWLTTEISPL